MKIGVFDSGIGGLTVLQALRRACPGLDMVYLGDTARVPYGSRSPETITKYSMDDAAFLCRQNVDAIVVGCNTVSAVALETLRQRLDVPVWGVIESAAQEAAAHTRSGTVGVIATSAAVASGAYQRAVAARRPETRILSQACPLLVPLIENGVSPEDPVAALVTERYLRPLLGQEMDVLILGCTHYPVYRPLFRRLLPGVELINTGEALARVLAERLDVPDGEGRVEYYVTERSAAFADIVHIMDSSVDAESIHVDASFI